MSASVVALRDAAPVAEAAPSPPRMRHWVPDTTIGQILGILLGGLSLTLATIMCLLVWLHPDETVVLRAPRSDALQIASLIEALRAAPVASRTAIAAGIHTPGLGIRLRQSALCAGDDSADPGAQALTRALGRLLPDDAAITVRDCRPRARAAGREGVIAVGVRDLGVVFEVNVGSHIPVAVLLRNWVPLTGSFVFLFFLVAVLSVWAVLRIIGPLHRLADTVERFGREVAVAPLTEEGPREIRLAARAFNLMQLRVAASVRDRSRTLAAISHDLRTPITRMRLRVELEQSGEYRAKTLRDLDLMQQMISSALAFLRGTQTDETREVVELGSLLQTLCDEAGESGADVAFEGQESIFCRCGPNALSRAVTNLVENACRYGGRARVAAREVGGSVWIEVTDAGPGIPAALQREALLPFSRLDPARAAGEGSGLGLAIVDDIARSHGGRLELVNRAEGGLLARVVVPRG